MFMSSPSRKMFKQSSKEGPGDYQECQAPDPFGGFTSSVAGNVWIKRWCDGLLRLKIECKIAGKEFDFQTTLSETLNTKCK